MGVCNSTATPSDVDSQAAQATQPPISHTASHKPARTQSASCQSSSTSAEPTAALARARLRMRRRRMKRKGKSLDQVARVVTVNVGEGKGKAAARVARQLVGERILLFWPTLSVWVDCEVVKYGGSCREFRGLHEVKYEDGVCEWRVLKRFRVVVGGKVFVRAMLGKGVGGKRGVEAENG